jgi:uncharacterized small protein (DUF1192 family)
MTKLSKSMMESVVADLDSHIAYLCGELVRLEAERSDVAARRDTLVEAIKTMRTRKP